MASDPIDVLVVGAGPTGLALALQAADHGATVRIVEQREKQFRPSRALIVNPRTLEVLRPLGVTDALLARGDASPSVELHLRSGIVNAQLGTLDLPDSAFPHLLLIRQSDVEAVLAEALTRRNIEVERGVEIVDITPLPDRGRATTADGGRIDARFVVGCDGPTSVVRTAMGTTWCGRPYRQEVVLADLELGGDLTSGAAHASPGPQGLVFLFSLGEQATWRLLATRSAGPGGSPFGQPGPPVTTAELQALLAGGGLDVRIADVKWSARVPLQHRLAGSYRSGRLFLAGDAAHTHSPAGGQGMNTGIQDAANLGWKLALAARAGDAASAALLDSYEHERRPIARHVLLLTDLVFWTEASTHPLARAARAAVSATGRALLPTLLRRRRLLAEGVRTLGQLRVNYRCSPLSLNGTRAAPGFPRAGARLGDAAVPTPSGARRLHELTATPGIHLFVARDCALPDLDPPPDLVSVHRLAMPGRVLAAIRPDGYVGFSGECSELPLLQRWLALVGAADRSRPLHPSDPALTPG